MHLHTFNDTDVICFVIYVLKYDTEIILYGLSNDIDDIKMQGDFAK